MPIDLNPPGPGGEDQDQLHLAQWRTQGLGLLARLAAEYGDVVLFHIDTYPIYLINDPSLVQQVFVDNGKHLQKPEAIKVSNRGHWGEGLTSLDGDAWRSRKRLMQPAFHRQEIARWSRVIVECTDAMIAGWRPGQEIQLFQELVDLRAEIAARTVLDAIVGVADESGNPGDVIPLEEARGCEFILTAENSQGPYLGMRRPRAAADSKEMVRIIRRRLTEPPDRQDVLSMLMVARDSQGHPLASAEIVDEVLQMFFAGHLTVPTWLVRLWYVLWFFPEIDAKVTQESERGLGERLPTYEDLPQLLYGAQVIQETGRYFAPAPILYREVATSFSVAGYNLKQGAGLWICPQLLHHDPRTFEAPHQFRPHRFDSKQGQRIPRFAYLPFGAGPRTCIARPAAMTEMQLVLATICRTFRLRPVIPDGPGQGHLMTMPPPGNLTMRVEARARQPDVLP